MYVCMYVHMILLLLLLLRVNDGIIFPLSIPISEVVYVVYKKSIDAMYSSEKKLMPVMNLLYIILQQKHLHLHIVSQNQDDWKTTFHKKREIKPSPLIIIHDDCLNNGYKQASQTS